MLIKLSRVIIWYFFWYLAVFETILIIRPGLGFFYQGLGACTIILFFCTRREFVINGFDAIVLTLLLYIPFTWIINDYGLANKTVLVLRCLFSQYPAIMFYYFGRQTDGYPFLEGKRINLPYIICAIIGVYCFFFPPAWYTAKVLAKIEMTGGRLLEASRLHSIFPSPYNMSYMATIIFMYLLFKVDDFRSNRRFNMWYLLLLVVVLLLCMQRTPIIGAVIAGVIYYVSYVKKNGVGKSIYVVACVIIAYVALIKLGNRFMDAESIDFFMGKFESLDEEGDEMAMQRMTVADFKLSFFGDGVGRHAIFAHKYGEPIEIRDSEYLRMIIEQGVFGVALFVLLSIISLVKCIKNIKYLKFELCILLFYLIACIGANPLNMGDKYGFVFWYAIGQISAFNTNRSLNGMPVIRCNKQYI